MAWVFSLTVAENGTFNPFEIGAVLYDEAGNEISSFLARSPYKNMLKSFAKYYLENCLLNNAVVVMCDNWFGIQKIMKDMYDYGFISYQQLTAKKILDVRSFLIMYSRDLFEKQSVYSYNFMNNLGEIKFVEDVPDSLYASRANAICFMHLWERLLKQINS